MRSLKKGILWLNALANCYSLSTDFTMFELLTHKIITKLLIPCFPTAGHFTQQHFYGAFVITSQSAGRTVCLWGNGAHLVDLNFPTVPWAQNQWSKFGQALWKLYVIHHLFQRLCLVATHLTWSHVQERKCHHDYDFNHNFNPLFVLFGILQGSV